ncbi:hypothetical protein LINGRAHAP2_LOCUS35994 [Linum grandiflorum]
MLEAAEEAIEDLRGEGKKWERTARKLMLQLDFLKKENLELSRNQGNLAMEFSEVGAERDGLRKEVEQLKLKLKQKQNQTPVNDHQSEGAWELAKELEREIRFQKQANGNLTMQLKRSQESNLELVAVLQDLEETLEKQKVEIEGLYDMELRFGELEDALEESLEKNRILEADLESVTRENEIASRCLNDLQNDLAMISCNVDTHVSVSKKKEFELERDKQELELCLSELRQENEDLSIHIVELETQLSCRSESSESGFRVCDLEEELKKKLIKDKTEIDDSAEEIERLKLELEVKVTQLSTQLDESRTEIERLETTLEANEQEILNLQRWKRELEARTSVIQEEKDLLEQKIEAIMIENDIATRCFSELQSELIIIGNSVDSHISAKESLERKSLELERQNHNLEQQLARIELDNRELLTRITDLETQLRSKAASELVSLMQILEEKEEQLREAENECKNLSQELDSMRNEMEVTVSEHTKELSERMLKIKALEDVIQSKEEESRNLKMSSRESESESEILALEKETCHVEHDMRNRLEGLMSAIDTLDPVKIRSTELETDNLDLQLQKHQWLSSLVNNLEAKTMQLRSEWESTLLELEKSKFEARNLQDEVARLRNEIETENLNTNNQLHEDQKNVEIQSLKEELAAVKENQERMVSENRRISCLLEDYKLSEEKLRTLINDLELQLTASELRNEIETEKFSTNNQLHEVDNEHQKNVEIQRLKEEVAAFKENQERLESENRRISCQLEDYKLSEEKHRTKINDLELKLTVSEYDRKVVKEEAMKLKTELLKLGLAHEQVLALKNELRTAKSSLDSVTAECKLLESEKNSLLDVISVLKKLVAELEEHKTHSVELEAKLKQTENELMMKEALCERDEDELHKIREANKQLHKRIKELENENEHCRERVRTLEEELIQNQNHNIDFSNHQREDDEHSKTRNLTSSQSIIQSERFETELGQTSNNNNGGENSDLERTEEEESPVERELREIRERYLHMSLKYAEVEAQRGELVMRLRAATNARVSF